MFLINKKKDGSQVPDNTLLERYFDSGDMDRLGTLYNRYLHLVYGVCMKYLKDRDNAKDAVMQIFEKLVETLRREKVRDFNKWIYTVARNHCLMMLRDNKKRTEKEDQVIFMENAGVLNHGDDGIMEKDIEILRECIETLPENQKTCIEMFYFGQKSYREISETTRLDMNNIKSYIQNGKRNLKNCVESKTDGHQR
jgi:RNA polymerase sigma-70 factor (ECF subfamily)